MKIAAITASAAALVALLSPADAYTVTVTPSKTLMTWEGWGTSLAWWANVFGARTDVADALFSTKDAVAVKGVDAPVPGLGFNILRYNVGGTSKNSIDDSGKKRTMKASSKMPAFKEIESYWIDWFSKDPASTSWNWKADATQRSMMTLAKARGANIFEAFSNSPPWWMTNNGAVAGADNGKNDNLQTWNHDDFALYMATVAKHAKDNWGITFNYVEPFNEPMATWWTFPGTQEGCHFSTASQQSVLVSLRKHLDALGLKTMAITASDENSVDVALTSLQALSANASAMGTVTKINTHGYDGLKPYRGKNRVPLHDLVKKLGKSLWDSEYGEDDASGLSMAESIGLDINELGVSAFVYWQALDGGAWGLLQSNPGDNWIGQPNGKYHVLAQYSRHIRQGMTIVSSSDKKTVVAQDGKGLLVLATVNTGSAAQTLTYDLAAYTKVGTSATVWTTVTTATGPKYVKTTLAVTGKTLAVPSPAASVVTVEIPGTEGGGKARSFGFESV
jgi:galactan endo-1,6-beta-galactosidase